MNVYVCECVFTFTHLYAGNDVWNGNASMGAGGTTAIQLDEFWLLLLMMVMVMVMFYFGDIVRMIAQRVIGER